MGTLAERLSFQSPSPAAAGCNTPLAATVENL
jgi:hypothetical protein